MPKVYSEGAELQQKILAGVGKLADNVAATLGPRGRSVILSKPGRDPIVTKDGVTVADFIQLEDPVEQAAAQILKQVAMETNNLAGDGTTTSTVLAREILQNSQKYLMAGSSPVELKKGMDKAVEAVLEKIQLMSSPVGSTQEIENVATISANGDAGIGKLIATAADQAGIDGSVMVQDAKSMETRLELVEGFRFDSGYCAQAFVTNERKNSIEYDETLVLITDHKIDNAKSILPALELVAREGKPLVIVAEQIEGQALAALIMNAVRGTMKVAAIKAPRYGTERINIMKDLCLSIGATFLDRASGKKLEEVELVDFGVCKKIEILKNETTIMGGMSDWDEIDKKIESLKSEIKQTDNFEECKVLQERIARLASGIVIVHVGGATEVEMIEKKHRIEDSLEAVRAAMSEGVVPGGGTTLLLCQDFSIDAENDDQLLGAQIIRKSLEAPVRQMAKNAGQSADIIIEKIKSKNKRKKSTTSKIGWDFKNDRMVDMTEAGIIDPAKVTRIALQNSVSVASTLVTTNNAIIEV